MLRCNGIQMLLSVTTIRYTHFHWLIYNLNRSRQEVTRTCLKRGCILRATKTKGERNKRANFIRIDKIKYDTWCGLGWADQL